MKRQISIKYFDGKQFHTLQQFAVCVAHGEVKSVIADRDGLKEVLAFFIDPHGQVTNYLPSEVIGFEQFARPNVHDANSLELKLKARTSA